MDVKSHFADKRLPDWLLRSRIPILVAVHLFAFSVAHFAAYLIRFDGSIPDSWMASFWYSLPWVCAIQLLCFWLVDSFHGWWRYVTLGGYRDGMHGLRLSSYMSAYEYRKYRALAALGDTPATDPTGETTP